MNKKGMLANLVGGIIVILIGVSLVPMISQEITNAISCNSSSQDTNLTSDYFGSTDSFGGGGSEHFGGYDGKVSHKPFLSNLAIYKTDKSIINPNCRPLSESETTIIKIVPIFFMLTILGTAIASFWGSFRNVEM